jgi:hypothetical protein
VTALADRITECPEVYDAARGADVYRAVLTALVDDPALAEAAELAAAPETAALLQAVF